MRLLFQGATQRTFYYSVLFCFFSFFSRVPFLLHFFWETQDVRGVPLPCTRRRTFGNLALGSQDADSLSHFVQPNLLRASLDLDRIGVHLYNLHRGAASLVELLKHEGRFFELALVAGAVQDLHDGGGVWRDVRRLSVCTRESTMTDREKISRRTRDSPTCGGRRQQHQCAT